MELYLEKMPKKFLVKGGVFAWKPEEISWWIPAIFAGWISEETRIRQTVFNGILRAIPEKISGRLPAEMSERISEGNSGQFPEATSGRIWEKIFETESPQKILIKSVEDFTMFFFNESFGEFLKNFQVELHKEHIEIYLKVFWEKFVDEFMGEYLKEALEKF